MYLSHLRKTEIRNFSSVLRILWDEFRNYLCKVYIAFAILSSIYCISILNIAKGEEKDAPEGAPA